MKNLNLVAAFGFLIFAQTVSAQTLTPTYASLRANIFETKCQTCHDKGGEADDTPLSDYTALMA